MRHLTFLLLINLTVTLCSYGQSDTVCAVKIGGNYYINCKHIITFQGQDVLTITNIKDNSIKINFDIFSLDGKKVAVVKNGQMVSGDQILYSIKSSEKEYTFVEKSTNRIIYHVKKVFSQEEKRYELHIWIDIYMPDGFYFQCTPETTNVPFLKYDERCYF